MLENLAKNIVGPSYASFEGALVDLQTALDAYRLDDSEGNVIALRDAFGQAYIAWQSCSPHEFGPAANLGFRLTVNTFPCDTARVHVLLSSESYDLKLATNAAAKGFPALDFILYKLNDARWAEPSVQAFIQANIDLIHDDLHAIQSEWNETYRDEFETNLGSDVGSALGTLVNAVNQDFELLKNANVGIPLGKKTLGETQAEKVEALYSGQSIPLLIFRLQAIKNVFEGGVGLGIDDQLDALGASYGEESLSKAITLGFDDAIEAAQLIDGSLHDAILDSPSDVENLHSKLQHLVVLLKTDMPSQLGVQITYQDNDGD